VHGEVYKGRKMASAPKEGRITAAVGLAAFAASTIFAWQGLDFTDMGYWLTGYQQFYTHPDTIVPSCWLSSFIGHWAGRAFGEGLIAYRLSYVTTVTAAAAVAYRLLASKVGSSWMLGAAVMVIVFLTGGAGGNWISYNELTALFYVAGAALLYLGLERNRGVLVVASGLLLGANVFVRLPNVVGISLLSAIWLQAWVFRWGRRQTLVSSAQFLFGFGLGIAAIWAVIVAHGHAGLYRQGILALFGLLGNDSQGHSGPGLLKMFIRDTAQALGFGLTLAVFGGWTASWISKRPKKLVAAVLGLGIAPALLALSLRSDWQRIIPGLCYVVLLVVVFREAQKDRGLALLAFIAGLVLVVAPLGSNNGINNSVFGIWLALPLTLVLLWKAAAVRVGQFAMEGGGARVLALVVLVALAFLSIRAASTYTYHDAKSRLAMTTSIEHPLMRGSFTTPARAKVVGELLEAMSRYARPGDEVLSYNAIPLIHFLTATRPWLGVSWPDINSPSTISRLIQEKVRSGAGAPCIVRATGSTYVDSWPVPHQPLAAHADQDKTRQVITDFVQSHAYAVVWSNDFFEILTSPQTPSKL
jgi:hypothetical protein